MKKILTIFAIALMFLTQTMEAKAFKGSLSTAIKKSDISNSAMIAVSFKEVSTSKPAFELNASKPMTPASIQKVATLLPSLNTLGGDYEFKTQLYKCKNGKDSKEDNLFIKLGADPYFTTADLKSMIRTLNNNKIYSTKAFYIDDSILDSNEWGEGWQWDDDLSPLMPKFGSYNMDKNLFTVTVRPTIEGAPAEIFTNVFYPTAFVNNVVTGKQNNIKLERKNYISPDVINADGTVVSDVDIQIPVNYPRRYFILRLEDTLRKQKFGYYGDFNRLKLPKDASLSLIAEIKHSLNNAVDDILKKSNNMMAETVFKLAGGKYANEIGSMQAATDMFNDYYKKLGINTDNIKVVDGSGVSKNNLVTADFMTDILVKTVNKPEDLKCHLATPGEGTLTDRMLYFKDNLRAKTGTLSNISTITGYITVKSGKTYAFCIMVNDSKSKPADKKAFEEYVLREAYDSL